jgi:hypothetical protein
MITTAVSVSPVSTATARVIAAPTQGGVDRWEGPGTAAEQLASLRGTQHFSEAIIAPSGEVARLGTAEHEGTQGMQIVENRPEHGLVVCLPSLYPIEFRRSTVGKFQDRRHHSGLPAGAAARRWHPVGDRPGQCGPAFGMVRQQTAPRDTRQYLWDASRLRPVVPWPAGIRRG